MKIGREEETMENEWDPILMYAHFRKEKIMWAITEVINQAHIFFFSLKWRTIGSLFSFK